MTEPAAKKGWKDVFIALATNEAVIYTVLGLLGLGLLYIFIKWAQGWWSQFVDWIMSLLQKVVPKPSSQNPSNRTFLDNLTGLVWANQGDRALSDAVDGATGATSGSGDTAYTEERIAQLQAQGYMDANGQFTAAGLAASQAGQLTVDNGN